MENAYLQKCTTLQISVHIVRIWLVFTLTTRRLGFCMYSIHFQRVNRYVCSSKLVLS
jgi:hypothetical protein